MNNALEPHVYCNLILGLINVSFSLWRKEKEQTKTRERVSFPPNFVDTLPLIYEETKKRPKPSQLKNYQKFSRAHK